MAKVTTFNVLFSSTLEPRSVSLCDSAPPSYVPRLSPSSAARPGHAPAPASCACLSMGCNHRGRGCGGAKVCHMLSGQLESLLEGGDMGKRGTAEHKLDIASHCLQSKHYCITKAETHHTSVSKQLVSEPPRGTPPFFSLKKYKSIIKQQWTLPGKGISNTDKISVTQTSMA